MATGLLRPSDVLQLLANPRQGSGTAGMSFMISLHVLCPPLTIPVHLSVRATNYLQKPV